MKLLVDTPTGAQEIIEVGKGGGYFDDSRVVWHEGRDGTMPEITLGGMVRADNSLEFSQDRMDEHEAALAIKAPVTVTMAQARKALVLSGITMASVQAGLEAIVDATERELALIDWEFAATVSSDSALVVAMAGALEIEDTGPLFEIARTL